ncbi:MAG: hypothetical protein LW835_16745, partial [Burkholderiaceae bacterium]|nr:hypothetical protein [Burkholderiaceae bacterium]
MLTRHLLDAAGLKADEGHGGAVTPIQHFGSATNLIIHRYCPVLDGVYPCGDDGMPVFVAVQAPSDEAPHALLQTVIAQPMKTLTRQGVRVDDTGQTWLAELDADGEEARMLRPLPAAAITYRMTFGPRAGQKVLHDARPTRRARSTTCRLRAPRAARTQPAGRYGLHHPQGLSAGRGYSGSLHGVALGPARRKPQAVG